MGRILRNPVTVWVALFAVALTVAIAFGIPVTS